MSNSVTSEISISADGKMETELTGYAILKQLLSQGYRDVAKFLICPSGARKDAYMLGIGCSPIAILWSDPEQSRCLTLDPTRRDFMVVNGRELRVRFSHWQLFQRPIRAQTAA